MLICAETGIHTGSKKQFYRRRKAYAAQQLSSPAPTEHILMPHDEDRISRRERQHAATLGTTIIAENANIAHCEKSGAFCFHSRIVDNKTLRHNVLPTYPQVINTLFTRFSTQNRRQRSLVYRATKPVLACKQDFLAVQQRLLCTCRIEKRAKNPLRSMKIGWERAAVGSGLQLGAVKVFYFFFSCVLLKPQAAGNIGDEMLERIFLIPTCMISN